MNNNHPLNLEQQNKVNAENPFPVNTDAMMLQNIFKEWGNNVVQHVNFALVVILAVGASQFAYGANLEETSNDQNINAKIEGALTQLEAFHNLIQGNAQYVNGKISGLPDGFWAQPQHKSALLNFYKTMRSLFQAGSGDSGLNLPTEGQLLAGMSPARQAQFNKYFNSLKGEFNFNVGGVSFNAITTDPNAHVSVLQMMIFEKVKGMIGKKIAFGKKVPTSENLMNLYNPNPANGSGDPLVQSLLSLLNATPATVTAGRKNLGTESAPFASIIFEGLGNPNSPDYNERLGALENGANLLAADYIYTNNPNGGGSDTGIAHGDPESAMYGDTQASQSYVGSVSNQLTSTLQGLLADIQTLQSTGQTVTKSANQATADMVNNQKSN